MHIYNALLFRLNSGQGDEFANLSWASSFLGHQGSSQSIKGWLPPVLYSAPLLPPPEFSLMWLQWNATKSFAEFLIDPWACYLDQTIWREFIPATCLVYINSVLHSRSPSTDDSRSRSRSRSPARRGRRRSRSRSHSPFIPVVKTPPRRAVTPPGLEEEGARPSFAL